METAGFIFNEYYYYPILWEALFMAILTQPAL